MSEVVKETLITFLKQLSFYYIDDPNNNHIIQLGINPEIEADAIIIWNITPLLAYYNFRFPESTESITENVKIIMIQILNLINSTQAKNGMWQGSAENVHDSTVNISLKKSYDKIKNSVVDCPQIYPANILSCIILQLQLCMANYNSAIEFINKYTETFISFLTIEKEKLSVDELLEHYSTTLYLQNIITQYQKTFNELQNNIKIIIKAKYVIETIIQQNVNMTMFEANQITILTDVWKRIHHPVNKEKLTDLINNFLYEMSLLYNPEKENYIECPNGCVAGIINSLSINDAESIVSINSLPILKLDMTQNRAPMLLQTAIQKYRDENGDEEYEKYNRGEDNKLSEYIKEFISSGLAYEFGELIPKHIYEKLLDEIINAVV